MELKAVFYWKVHEGGSPCSSLGLLDERKKGQCGKGREIGTRAYIPGYVTGAARRLYLVEEKRVGNVSQQVKDSEAVGGRTKSTCHPSQDPSYSL